MNCRIVTSLFFVPCLITLCISANADILPQTQAYQNRVALLRDQAQQDITAYWVAIGGMATGFHTDLKDLPPAIQNDFFALIMCDVLDQLIGLAHTPKSLSDFGHAKIKVENGQPIGTQTCTMLELNYGNGGDMRDGLYFGFYSKPK